MKKLLILVISTLAVVNLYSQWELINIDLENNSSNYHVDFKDDQLGIILKGTNQFIKTEDGGSTWDTISTELFTLVDFEYLNGDTIIGLGRDSDASGLYWSYDNGENWNLEILLSEDIIYDFTKSGDIIILACNKRITKYNLSNTVYEEVYDLSDDNYSTIGGIGELFQTSDSIIYASGIALSDVDSLFKSLILKSTNAGSTWDVINTHDDFSFSTPSLHFWNDNLGFYIIKDGSYDYPNLMYKTDDGGNSWLQEGLDFHGQNVDISFPTDSVGFIISGEIAFGWEATFYSFSILKTINMGQTWEYQYLNHVGAPIWAVDFITDSLGFVVGEYDLIMRTNTCGGEIDEDYPFSYFIVSNDEIFTNDAITVYPNPTSSFVNVSISSDNSLHDFEINIYTITGSLVLKKNYVQQNEILIDLFNIQNGVLIVEVKTDKGSYMKKLIKK